MNTVIETYRIQFVTQLIHNHNRDLMHSVNGILDQFIDDFKTVSEINDFLLVYINNILTGISPRQTVISESMVSAEMTLRITNLYADPDYQPGDPPDFSLPTTHLKEIAEAWLDYLQDK